MLGWFWKGLEGAENGYEGSGRGKEVPGRNEEGSGRTLERGCVEGPRMKLEGILKG